MAAFTGKLGAEGQAGWVLPILRVLQIALLVTLGWVIIRSVLLLTNPESLWTPLPSVTAASPSGSSAAERIYNFSSDPFRLPASEEPEVIAQAEGFDAPETTLKIRLLGRISGSSQIATLRTPDNQEQSYTVGDEVMNGVTLQNVYPDFVVLKVNGEVQRLTFQRDEKTGLSQPQTDRVSQSVSIAGNATEQSNLNTTNPSKKIDPSALMKSVQLNPNFESGTLIGYEIRARSGEANLEEFGLQSGDIVTAINGNSLLQSQPDLQGLITNLKNANQVKLDILRDGRPVTVQIGS
ncbi:type II secretion system protein N [Litorimonas sp.]|uniref:type II secretion system protein N n=1 Tax=Litorimonas sp. TaxID=1892381 RepID=UPI003A836F8C